MFVSKYYARIRIAFTDAEHWQEFDRKIILEFIEAKDTYIQAVKHTATHHTRIPTRRQLDEALGILILQGFEGTEEDLNARISSIRSSWYAIDPAAVWSPWADVGTPYATMPHPHDLYAAKGDESAATQNLSHHFDEAAYYTYVRDPTTPIRHSTSDPPPVVPRAQSTRSSPPAIPEIAPMDDTDLLGSATSSQPEEEGSLGLTDLHVTNTPTPPAPTGQHFPAFSFPNGHELMTKTFIDEAELNSIYNVIVMLDATEEQFDKRQLIRVTIIDDDKPMPIKVCL
ncbi:MAG: hypothetical protein Q9168_004980 [Polycauliona sp. 1 TL-2023]